MYVGRGRTHPSCCIGASLQQFLYPIQQGVAKIKIPTLVLTCVPLIYLLYLLFLLTLQVTCIHFPFTAFTSVSKLTNQRLLQFELNTVFIVQVILHHQSLLEQAVITKLVAQLNKSSGEVIKRHPRCLTRNSNAVVELEISHAICMELYRDIKELGRFMLRVGGITIAAGLVTQVQKCL